MSMERDAESEAQLRAEGVDVPDIPPQLLFIHQVLPCRRGLTLQGQEDVKEVHWHPQIDGVLGTTAADGFNIFKTINSSSS
jgi:ribosome assembly protein RRB1